MVNSILVVFLILIAANFLYGCCSIEKDTYAVAYGIGFSLCILLVFCMMMIGFGAQDPFDYYTYYKVYTLGADVFEPGYNLISKIACDVGLSFFAFRNILIAISIIMLFVSLNLMHMNCNIAIALYGIVSMTLDFIQIRNFLAFSIVLFSLHWLFENTKKGKIKYLIGVLVASSIHSISLVYLLFLLYDGNEQKKSFHHKILVALFVGMLCMSVLMKVGPISISSISQYLFLFNEQKEAAYTMSSLQWGFLLFWLPEIIFIMISWYIRKKTMEISAKETAVVADSLFWLNICIACLFPLCIVNINFVRIFRNFAIVNYGLLPVLLSLPKDPFWFWNTLLFIINIILLFWIDYGSDMETFLFFF